MNNDTLTELTDELNRAKENLKDAEEEVTQAITWKYKMMKRLVTAYEELADYTKNHD